MGPGTRYLVSAARIVHLVCSMLGLGMVGLLAVSGIAMTHEGFFGLGEPDEAAVPCDPLPGDLARQSDQEAIVRHLRDAVGMKGAVDAFEVDPEETLVVFTRPGMRSQAIIQRSDGRVEITTERGGILALLADLHKDENAGEAWKWLVTAGGACLLLACLTGIVLWLATPKRRLLGLVALAVGLAGCLAAYVFFVP